MSRRVAVAALYTAFAALATAANIAIQWTGLALYRGPLALSFAMGCGTAAGLGLCLRRFSACSLMGLATTALFWATELAFDAATPDGRWRFLGAALGLAAGYAAKYRLDRRFVFGTAP